MGDCNRSGSSDRHRVGKKTLVQASTVTVHYVGGQTQVEQLVRPNVCVEVHARPAVIVDVADADVVVVTSGHCVTFVVRFRVKTVFGCRQDVAFMK